MPYDVLDDIPDPIVRLDRECRYLWVNRTVATKMGVDARTLVGRRHGEADDGATEADVSIRDAVEQVFRTGEPATARLFYRRTDVTRCYEAHVAPERDAAGDIQSVLVVGRDVTHLVAVEHALQERVKELRCLQAATRALDRIDEDVDGALRDLCELLPSGWQHPDIACARVVIDGREHRTAGFHACACSQRADVVVEGVGIGFLEVGYRAAEPFLPEERDLIDALARRVAEALRRLRAERALVESREELRALVEASSDVIAVVDRQGRIRFISQSCQTSLGLSQEALIDTNILDLVHPEDRGAVKAALADVVARPDHVGRVEYRLRHADGAYLTVETTGRNRLDDPAVRGIVTSTRDLTERRQLEGQLVHAQKMEAVGRLAGGIAHDFNNVLTIIESSGSFLADELAEGDPRREDVEAILAAARRASGLTRRLLAFSRKQVMQPRLIDLAALVRDVEKLLRRLVTEDVELVSELDPVGAWVRADPGQIEQVLLNLVVNAREAMPRGGRITITVRPAGDPSHGRTSCLEVRDTGAGMDDAVRQRMFDPFFTTKEGGTGLGLATVFGIVQQSGGAIEVESELGRGTTMRVVLPAATAHDRPTLTTRPPAQLAFGTETVLVVEDEQALREVARRILERCGYRVLTAANGAEALSVAADPETRIDLLFSDVVMPGMSGREVAEAMRRVRPALRVLYTSGYTDDAILQHGLERNDARLLQKPFTPRRLADAVRQALDTAA